MGGGKKARVAYAGAEHSNIKQAHLDVGHVSLITKEFWCKTTAGGPVSPVVDI